jgi:hypothetical protein
LIDHDEAAPASAVLLLVVPSIEFRWASINGVHRLSIQGEQEGAKNLHAKKFDASQRAIIAARLRPFYDKLAKERQLRKPADFVVQKVAQQDQSDQHRIYSLAEEREAFDRKKARDEAGKAAITKVTLISLHRNGANGKRCR